jgi:hypothetical protein
MWKINFWGGGVFSRIFLAFLNKKNTNTWIKELAQVWVGRRRQCIPEVHDLDNSNCWNGKTHFRFTKHPHHYPECLQFSLWFRLSFSIVIHFLISHNITVYLNNAIENPEAATCNNWRPWPPTSTSSSSAALSSCWRNSDRSRTGHSSRKCWWSLGGEEGLGLES